MIAARRLVYDWFKLPHVYRIEIMEELGVIEDGDESLPESDRPPVWFRRVRNRGLINKLRDLINAKMERMSRAL